MLRIRITLLALRYRYVIYWLVLCFETLRAAAACLNLIDCY